jgi:hypothetical protein
MIWFVIARHIDENDWKAMLTEGARAPAARPMISPAGGTVGKLTMPFCRSITIKAAVVSSFVIGKVSFRLGGVEHRADLRSSG